VYQLTTTKAKAIFIHPASEAVAREAADVAGIPQNRIVLLPGPVSTTSPPRPRLFLEEFVVDGLRETPSYTERRLRPGEGKTKLAFLSFSSGTTGRPKAVAIPHHSVIANVLQMAKFHRVGDETYNVPHDLKRFRIGDVAAGGELRWSTMSRVAVLLIVLVSMLLVLPLFRESPHSLSVSDR
jgi:4-coumarate--CoA ligase